MASEKTALSPSSQSNYTQINNPTEVTINVTDVDPDTGTRRADAAKGTSAAQKRKSKRPTSKDKALFDAAGKRATEKGGHAEPDLSGLKTAELGAIRNKLIEESGIDGWNGKNELPEDKLTKCQLFLKQFKQSMPAVIATCALLSLIALILSATSGESPISDVVDLCIILLLLFLNAILGYREELHAQEALEELRGDLTAEIQARRNDEPTSIEVTDLLPGDIILLKGGDIIPADSVHVEGDTVKVDTAPLTGEPIPWSVPRNQSSDDEKKRAEGMVLWSGCTVTNGECLAKVMKIGPQTEIGQAFTAAGEQGGATKSGFERSILTIVTIVICIAVCVALCMIVVTWVPRNVAPSDSLEAGVALLVGSVPIALPLVLVVTMAIGSVTMSGYNALVTNMPALQEIASMTVLCSDKTGTLTTAKMAVYDDKMKCYGDFAPAEVFELATACCNRDNAGDAIDGGIMRKYDENQFDGDFKKGSAAIKAEYTIIKANGFHNLAKRTLTWFKRKDGSECLVAKGYVPKMLSNDEDDESEIEEQIDRWTIENYDELKDQVLLQDEQMGKDGYKVIGVSKRELTPGQYSPDLKFDGGKKCKLEGGPWQFCGIIPMIDPPRVDTALTIQRVRDAGVEVKMITGDHQNIARTTAGLINLGTNILASKDLQIGPNQGPESRNKLIRDAHGFAGVLPTDKMEVVLALQGYGLVVGFSGDGVNDVPALAAAEVGIAVHGATDAANAVADIQLLSPGLSCIYTAIVESRKIFRRLKAYVIFRVAATVQIVVVLGVITLVSGCVMPALNIIILALSNDISMLPLSSDRQRAAKNPEKVVIWKIIVQAMTYGLLAALFSLIWFYFPGYTSTADNQLYTYYVDNGPCHTAPALGSWKTVSNIANAKYCNSVIDTACACNTGTYMACPASSSFPSDLYPSENTDHDQTKVGLFEPYPAWTGTKPSDYSTTNSFTEWYNSGYVNPARDCSDASSCKWQKATLSNAFAMNGTTIDKPDGEIALDASHFGLMDSGKPWSGNVACPCTDMMANILFLQIFLSSEFLIFPCRTLSWFFTSAAARNLYISVFGINILITLCIAFGLFNPVLFNQGIGWVNAAYTWAYVIVEIFLLDIVKIAVVKAVEGSTDEIATDMETISEKDLQDLTKPGSPSNVEIKEQLAEQKNEPTPAQNNAILQNATAITQDEKIKRIAKRKTLSEFTKRKSNMSAMNANQLKRKTTMAHATRRSTFSRTPGAAAVAAYAHRGKAD